MTEPNIRSEERRRNTLMAHTLRRVIPLIVLALVLAGGYLFWRHVDGRPTHEPAPAAQGPVPVNVIEVRRETLPLPFRFLGQTEGSQVVEIRARVAGYLEPRNFTEGQRVEKGQKLFQIDPRPFQVELTQAQAQLASAQATLERAQVQLKRVTELRATSAVSQQELEDWQTQARVAAAAVEQHKAAIAAAQLQLGYTSIESPVTGMIGRSLKDVGSYVDAGQNGLLAVVQQVDPIYVRYSVTEQEMLRYQRQVDEGKILSPGIENVELEITLADGSTYPRRGRLNFVDIQVDQTTGTTVVRGQVPNPEAILRPGQFIYANVLGIQRVDVVRVPQSAVQQSPAGATVLVVGPDAAAQARPVTLGDWLGDFWVIERGLSPGDRVVTTRVMTVRPGTPLTPTVVPLAPVSDRRLPSTVPATTQPAAATRATNGGPRP